MVLEGPRKTTRRAQDYEKRAKGGAPRGIPNKKTPIALRIEVLRAVRAGELTLHEASQRLGLKLGTVRKMKLAVLERKAQALLPLLAPGKLRGGAAAPTGRVRYNAAGRGAKPSLPTLRQAFKREIIKATIVQRKRVPKHVARHTIVKICEEVYPTGMSHPEVRAYAQRYSSVRARAKFQPGRKVMNAMLAEVAMEVKRLKDAMDFPGGSLHPPCLGGGALSKSAG